jgi:hypothetical protein
MPVPTAPGTVDRHSPEAANMTCRLFQPMNNLHDQLQFVAIFVL